MSCRLRTLAHVKSRIPEQVLGGLPGALGLGAGARESGQVYAPCILNHKAWPLGASEGLHSPLTQGR